MNAHNPWNFLLVFPRRASIHQTASACTSFSNFLNPEWLRWLGEGSRPAHLRQGARTFCLPPLGHFRRMLLKCYCMEKIPPWVRHQGPKGPDVGICESLKEGDRKSPHLGARFDVAHFSRAESPAAEKGEAWGRGECMELNVARQSRDNIKPSNMATMDTTRLNAQGFSVEFIDYHISTMDTTNAAGTSLDSKWTPRRHFSGVRWGWNSPTNL